MNGKPGRAFERQAPGQPITARRINQGLPILDALQRMGVGAGMAQRDGPGGIPLLSAIPVDQVYARITGVPTNGGHPYKLQYFNIDTAANTRTWVDLPTDETDALANIKDPVYEKNDGILPIGLQLVLAREAHTGALVYDGEGLTIKAKAPAGGILAKSGNTPQPATCTLYTWNKLTNSELLGSQTLTVRNGYLGTVGSNKDIWIVLRAGTWMVLTEACT